MKLQTYHRGDLFQNIDHRTTIYILAQVDWGHCVLVSLFDGNRWTDHPVEFKTKGLKYEITDDSLLWGSGGRKEWILLDKSFIELRYLGEKVGNRLFSENEKIKKVGRHYGKRKRMIRLI